MLFEINASNGGWAPECKAVLHWQPVGVPQPLPLDSTHPSGAGGGELRAERNGMVTAW